MKKLYIATTVAALPFLLVWVSFVLTGFAFSPREVFRSETFWGLSVMYWFLYTCLIGFIMEMIEEDNKVLNPKNKF